MRDVNTKKNSRRVIHGTVAVGNIVYFNVEKESNNVKNIELKDLFCELNDNTIDEYIQYREVCYESNKSGKWIEEILDFIFFTFDTGTIRHNFVRYVYHQKYDVSKAFDKALTEFMKSSRYEIPVSLLCVKQELNYHIFELKMRLMSRYENVMLQRRIRNINYDFILLIDEFKKDYLYKLPKRIQGIICKSSIRKELAFTYAHEFELPLAIHNFNYQENSKVILDGIDDLIIIEPSIEEINHYQEKLGKYTYKIGEDSGYLPSKINIYAPMVDLRNAEKIAYGNWFTGIAPFKTEFLYSTKGALPSYKEQYKMFYDLFTVMKDKEIYIRIPDFRSERPTEYLGSIYTDEDTFERYMKFFELNMLAIAKASKATGKEINMLAPMIRMSSEIEFWKFHIQAAFEYCDLYNVRVGIMFETGSAYEYYEEYKGMHFVIIGLNDLVEEISDDFDRYSLMTKDEMLEEFWPNLRDIHQYFRSYMLQVKHILAGNILSNPEIFRKFLKSGFRDFSIRQSQIKLIEKELVEYNETRGTFVGVAAERLAKKGTRRINAILRDKREREDKIKRAKEKELKKIAKEKEIRDSHKEKREEVIKIILSKNKKKNNDDENNEN